MSGYYEPGMSIELHRANGEYEAITRRVRPTQLVIHLGNALKYAQEYFRAKNTASQKTVEFIFHLDACDTCRTFGWEHCDDMKKRLSSGGNYTTMTL